LMLLCFFFQAEDGIRDRNVTGVQTCALPIFANFNALMRDIVKRVQDSSRQYSSYLTALSSFMKGKSLLYQLMHGDESLDENEKQIGRASCRERVWMAEGGESRIKMSRRRRGR